METGVCALSTQACTCTRVGTYACFSEDPRRACVRAQKCVCTRGCARLRVRACCLRACSSVPGAAALAVTLTSRESGPQGPRAAPRQPGILCPRPGQRPGSSARRCEPITAPPLALCENWLVSWKRGLSEDGVGPACRGRALHALPRRAGRTPEALGSHLRNRRSLRGALELAEGCGRAGTGRWCPCLDCAPRARHLCGGTRLSRTGLRSRRSRSHDMGEGLRLPEPLSPRLQSRGDDSPPLRGPPWR